MKKNSIIYTLGLALATASLVGCGPKAGPSLEGIRVKTQPTVTEYAYEYTGDVSLAGIEVEAYYSDETTKALAENDYQHSSLTPTAAAKLAGKFTVTLTYQEKTTTVDFKFREPDPFDYSWPAEKVANLVKDYADGDVVPAFNGAAEKYFVSEEDSAVMVIMPSTATEEQVEAAADAYLELITGETVGWKLNPSVGILSPKYTINMFPEIEGNNIYLSLEPHQPKDIEGFTEYFAGEDKYPESAIGTLDENAFADIYEGDPYLGFVVSETRTASAIIEELQGKLEQAGYFRYYVDSYGDQHFTSPHEEIDAVAYASSTGKSVYLDFYAIEAEDKFYTQGTAFPSEAIASFLGEDHATVPALADATRYLYGTDEAGFEIVAEFASNEAAVAANAAYVELLTDYDAAGDSTFKSKDGSVKLEVYVDGGERYVKLLIKDAAIFPLDAINAYLGEEYTEEQLPIVPKTEGVTFESSTSSGFFVVTVTYPDAEKMQAAKSAYAELFTEELGYTPSGSGFVNEELALRVGFIPSAPGAVSFAVTFSTYTKPVDVNGAVKAASGYDFNIPSLAVKSNIDVTIDSETYVEEYDMILIQLSDTSYYLQYASELATSLNNSYSFSYLGSIQGTYVFKSLLLPYGMVAVSLYSFGIGVQWNINEQQKASFDALSAALGVKNYESILPEINGNIFAVDTEATPGTIAVSYTAESEEAANSSLTEYAEALSDYGFKLNETTSKYETGMYSVGFGTTSQVVEEQTVYYALIYITPITYDSFPVDSLNGLGYGEIFPAVESTGVTFVFDDTYFEDYGVVYVHGYSDDAANITALVEALDAAFGSAEGWGEDEYDMGNYAYTTEDNDYIIVSWESDEGEIEFGIYIY